MYFLGLLDQQLHPAGAHPRDRHRGGRRDHRAGERVPPSGGAGRESRGGRRPTAPGRSRFAVIATTISLVAVFTPLAFLKGVDRPALQRVRHRRGGFGGHLGLRGADADADALRQDPAGAPAAWGALPRAGGRVQRAGVRVRPHARGGAAPPLGGVGVAVAGDARRGLVFRSLKREFVPPEDRGWFFSSSSRRRAPRWPTPTATSGRRRRSWPRPRASRATSAW